MRTLRAETTNHKRVLLLLHYYDYRHHAGVARYAAEVGWALEDAFTQANELPTSWTGDGVISFHGNSQPFVDWVKAAGVPVVDMGDDPGGSDLPRVTTDNDAIAAMAVEHFRAKGYRNVGFVWAADGTARRQRLQAVEAAAAANGLR